MVECRLVDECFAAFKLKKGKWVPCTLRVTNTAVERLDNMLTVLWRARFVDMKSPGAPTFVLGPANCQRMHATDLSFYTVARGWGNTCAAVKYHCNAYSMHLHMCLTSDTQYTVIVLSSPHSTQCEVLQ